MHNYLSTKTADYVSTIFSVTPQKIMPEQGDKEQIVHQFHDGTIEIVSLSDQSYFDVTVEWEFLNSTDEATVLDFWHDTNKGNGRQRTFYFEHPTDGYTYVARFLQPLTKVRKRGSLVGYRSITLRIDGVKA